jgi:hypothetical protein
VLAAVLVPAVVLPLLGAIGALVFAYVYYTKGALLSLLAFLEVHFFSPFFVLVLKDKRICPFVLVQTDRRTNTSTSGQKLTQMPPQSGGE